jgi:hypothetical protein
LFEDSTQPKEWDASDAAVTTDGSDEEAKGGDGRKRAASS